VSTGSRIQEALVDRLHGRRVVVADIGARDGLHARWRAVERALHLVAFEPDGVEARRLEAAIASRGATADVVTAALAGTDEPHELRLTTSPGCSSLLEPNREVLDRFPDAARFDVVERPIVTTTTLDAVLQQRGLRLHFAKIDVQGAALAVLDGGPTAVAEMVGVEVEVELVRMYQDQPLFGAVHERLLDAGLELIDFRPTYWRRTEVAEVTGTKGQIIFADALYLRSPESLATQLAQVPDADHHLLAAMLLSAVYGARDRAIAYARLRPGLADVVPILQPATFATRVPRLRWRTMLGHLAKDVGDALLTDRDTWALAEQGLGNAPRSDRLPWLR
jgi:FkbM family methyltransferase